MEPLQKPSTRKKFLLWGAALLSSVTILKFMPGGKKKSNEPPAETVKMLTQDGKLVEIDKRLIASTGNKISNKDLQNWVKK